MAADHRLGFLDSSLYLTQYNIIKELTRGAVRVGSLDRLLDATKFSLESETN